MPILLTTFSDHLLSLFGGLALFLFGINMMSESLKKVAGRNLRSVIEKTINTHFKSVLVGIVLTVLIQSSSGATALTVGLLRSGLMTLPQAAGIIIGSNIGTTITALIIGLPISEYGLLIVFVGVIMTFIKKSKTNQFGTVFIGLGLLFFGMNTMTDGLKVLSATKEAENLFTLFSRRWSVGSLFGILFTTVVQSSSVTIGILQKLYAINAEGVASITLSGTLPIMLGANIGTTVTALLSSIGGNIESKRASVIHLVYNIINTVFFLLLLAPFVKIVSWFELKFLKPYSMMTIAFAHIFQKTVMATILFFFIPQLVKVSEILVRDEKPKVRQEPEFDDRLIRESPVLALEFVKIALMYMGNTVYEYFKLVREYSFEEDETAIDRGEELENTIDSYDRRLHDYLIKIARAGLSAMDSKKLSRDLDTIKDFERIGDHLNNITGFFQERYSSNEDLSEDGANDLQEIYEVLDRMMVNTLKAFEKQDVKLARTVIQDEDYVDELERDLRYRYIERLKEQKAGFAPTYPDILANLERIGDHLKNIASSVIEPLYVPQSMTKF